MLLLWCVQPFPFSFLCVTSEFFCRVHEGQFLLIALKPDFDQRIAVNRRSQFLRVCCDFIHSHVEVLQNAAAVHMWWNIFTHNSSQLLYCVTVSLKPETCLKSPGKVDLLLDPSITCTHCIQHFLVEPIHKSLHFLADRKDFSHTQKYNPDCFVSSAPFCFGPLITWRWWPELRISLSMWPE